MWGVEGWWGGGLQLGQEALVACRLARPRFSHLIFHTFPPCPHTPAQAQPPQTDTLQRVAGAILGLLVFGSSLELALATNITKLPKETLDYFANPNNLNSDQVRVVRILA